MNQVLHHNKVDEVGSPFVVISKLPIEDPLSLYDQKTDHYLLLKTGDGTLISFREAWADSEGGANTGVEIELYDPNHLFIMQFMDNNIIKGFSKYSKSPEGLKSLRDAYLSTEKALGNDYLSPSHHPDSDPLTNMAWVESAKEPESTAAHWSLRFANFVGSLWGQDKYQDRLETYNNQLRQHELAKKVYRESLNVDFTLDNSFYITFGYGSKNAYSPSRQFMFTGFSYANDSGKLGSMKLKFTHEPGQSQNKEVATQVEAQQKRGIIDVWWDSNPPGSAALYQFDGGELESDDTGDIVFLMEYALQEYMKGASTISTTTPLVFLSPEVGPKIAEIMEEARLENILLGSTVQANLTQPLLISSSRPRSMRSLLNRFGFSCKMTGGGRLGSPATMSLTVPEPKDKKQTKIQKVISIIENIYYELKISRGSDIVVKNILHPLHIQHFFNTFMGLQLNKTTNSTLTLFDLAYLRYLPEEGVSYTTKELKTEYVIIPPFRFSDLVSDFGGSPRPPGVPSSITCIGDGYFIEGVLFKLPYAENEKSIPDFKDAPLGSNIHRFISNNYDSYLAMLKRVYVNPVMKSGGYDLPDEYALKLPQTIQNRLQQKIPSFLANVEHSNVLSFLINHNKAEEVNILNNLSPLFTRLPYHSIDKGGGTAQAIKKREKLTEAQIDVMVKSMLENEWENSTNMGLLVKNIKKGFNSEESLAASTYKEAVKALVVNMEKTTLPTSYKISENATLAYLLYLQKLSFHYLRLQVKTIPMFSMVSDYWTNKPCLFLHKKLYDTNSTNFLNEPTPYSGMYKILGLEHVITASECYSSFSLHRIEMATAEIKSSDSLTK